MVGEGAHDVDHVFQYFPLRLTSMRQFRVCHTNDRIWQVSANLHCRHQDSQLSDITSLFRQFEHTPIRGIGATFFVRVSDQECESIYGEFAVGVNMQHLEGRWSRMIQVAQFSGMADREGRMHFFDVAIDRLRLSENLQLIGNPDKFRIDAIRPLKMGISGADLKGQNPSLFWVELSESFDEAWSRIQCLLADPTIKHIDNISTGLTMTPDDFEVLHHKLNEFARGWQVSFYGSYADGIDPYTADTSLSPDGRFPIFTWMPARENQGKFFQADIVPTPNGRRLEIHSNCQTMQELLDEAEAATGVRFTPLDDPLAGRT